MTSVDDYEPGMKTDVRTIFEALRPEVELIKAIAEQPQVNDTSDARLTKQAVGIQCGDRPRIWVRLEQGPDG
jgi:hypothetical protein